MGTLGKPGVTSLQAQAERRRQVGYPAASRHFDLIAALLSLWFIVGLFVDGFAHNHGAVDDTFFTPYHALLYSGILATGLFLGVHQYRNIGRGYAFGKALPLGYNLPLIGVGLFFAGGGFDFLWHDMFGFEANIETLLSPAHLLLATSGVLILTGPIRSAWNRRESPKGWSALFPVVLALTLLLSVFTFFTMYASVFTEGSALAGTYGPSVNRDMWTVAGIASVLFPTALSMGVLLFALRRWRLPFGAVTFMLTVNTLAMFVLQFGDMRRYWFVVFAAPVAGIVGDVLLTQVTRSPFVLRLFSFAVPFTLSFVFFVILIALQGIWWRVHLWLGVSFVAGVVGVFLSYLAQPPAVPEQPS